MFRILIFATALIGAMMAAHADVYRWTDAQGHVQYSDRWVPGSVLIKTTGTHNPATPPPPQQTSDQQKLAASNAALADEQAQRQTEQTVQKDVAAARAEQCKKVTESYQKSIDSRRLYKEGKNGEREYLSEGEMEAYRAKLLNEKQQVCGK
jgi:uncharacterized protein DUF4124